MSEALIETERRWLDAFRRGAVEVLDEIWADDFVFTDPDGAVLTKQACLDAIRSGTLRFDEVEEERITAREMGDTGVVIGYVRLRGTVGEKRYDGRYSVLDVYARRHGRWTAVLSSGERAKTLTALSE